VLYPAQAPKPLWIACGLLLFVLPPWLLPYLLRRHAKRQLQLQASPPNQDASQRESTRHRAGEPSWDDDQENPLDVRMEVRVPEELFVRQESIHLQVPGEVGTISVQLKPHMRGKLLRLRGALKRGAGHLFVRVLVREETGPVPPSESNQQ